MGKPSWGGKRYGTGRKPAGFRRHDSPHRPRLALDARHPVHVVLRLKDDVPSLRTRTMYGVVHRVCARYLGRPDFRVVHVSIQRNHLHFLIEARDQAALRNGMQGLAICALRALNAALGRIGKIFAYRYHATHIVTARQARNALAYVLNNWRKHRQDCVSPRTLSAAIDPYSSGLAFSGWTERFAIPEGYSPLPTSPPSTRLLARDWRRHGLVEPFERPGPIHVW